MTIIRCADNRRESAPWDQYDALSRLLLILSGYLTIAQPPLLVSSGIEVPYIAHLGAAQ